MNKNKKRLLIGGFLGIALLILMLSLYSVGASTISHPKPSPTPDVLENGWHQFSDPEAGYSFSYPPDSLSISVGKDKGEKYNHLSIAFLAIEGYGYQGMVLYVLPNPKRIPVEDFLLKEFKGKWTKKSPPLSMSSTELGEFFTVGSNTAIKTTFPVYVEIQTAPFFVYIQNNDKIIATGPMYGLMKSTELAPQTEELFMQLLNTFVFDP